jgi:polar amino acid transport system substrate-binding protein
MSPLPIRMSRWLLAGSLGVIVLAAWTGLRGAPALAEAQTMTPMSDAAKAELAPNGRLRAGLNYSNFLLVSSRAPEHAGVAPDLARELARRAGAALEFVGYENAGLAADAARAQAWDVAFIGAEPARADVITFSPAYVEIEASYLVPEHSTIRSIADVDHEGVRIVSTARAAYTLYLQRTIRRAQIVEADGIAGAATLFDTGGYEALAGLTPRLREDVTRLAGTRLVPGRFTAVQQSMGVRKERAAAAAYLVEFIREIKASGRLARLIADHKADGLTIAR